VEISITGDWPLASEPGFVDARWEVLRVNPDRTVWHTPLAGGTIGPDGRFTARYVARCEEGFSTPAGYGLRVRGRFEAYRPGERNECVQEVPHRCTSTRQHVTLLSGTPNDPLCRPPAFGGVGGAMHRTAVRAR
jgi:hypothetical protein